jgi:hypothetical protein
VALLTYPKPLLASRRISGRERRISFQNMSLGLVWGGSHHQTHCAMAGMTAMSPVRVIQGEL